MGSRVAVVGEGGVWLGPAAVRLAGYFGAGCWCALWSVAAAGGGAVGT